MTMAYSTSNPPSKIAGPLARSNVPEAGGTTVPSMWMYSSEDPIATVQGAAYISNGMQLGLQVGDIIFVVDTNLIRAYMCLVVAVTPVAAATNAFQGAGLGSATLNSTTTPVAD
jgi:hypothetical protein